MLSIMCRNFIIHQKQQIMLKIICNIMENNTKMLKSFYGYLVIWYETKGCSQIPRLHFNFFCSTFHKLFFKILWIFNIPNIFKLTYQLKIKTKVSYSNGNEQYFKWVFFPFSPHWASYFLTSIKLMSK